MRVVCLEQGDWQDPARYPGAGPDWELQARKQWSSSPNVRGRSADYPIDFDDADLVLGNFNGVGGGTVLYSAVWPRLLPSDFRTRTEHGIADDWPLSYDDLAPHYEETDRQFGVSGLGGNPEYPPGADPPLPPLPIGRAGLALARAHARLGWHWWPEYNAILSAEHDGRHACVQRGSCGSGCNEGAKGSTDVTHWPRAIAAGVRLVTGARVRRIEVDGRGRARGATWLDADGHEHFQAADVVVCAANGIGTARLLLLSAHAGAPDGLANSSGLVGRRLMVHPGVMVDGYFDDDLQSYRGHFGGQINSLEFARTDPSRGFVGGTRWSLAPTGGPVAAAFGLRGRVVLGADHHEDHRSRFGRGARWVILCEDLPHLDNRVELSASLVDSDGLPAPKVTYRFSDDARRAIAWSTERASRVARRSRCAHRRQRDDAHEQPPARHRAHGRRPTTRRWSIRGGRRTTSATSPSSTGACSSPSAPPTRRAPSRRSRSARSSTCSHTASTCRSRNRPARSHCPNRPPPPLVPDPAPTPVLLARHRDANVSACDDLADALVPGDERMPAASEVGRRGRAPRRGAARPARPRRRPPARPRPRDRRSAGDDRRPPSHRPAFVPRAGAPRPRGVLPLARRAGAHRVAGTGRHTGAAASTIPSTSPRVCSTTSSPRNDDA